jgi:dienelactone hydrolase
VGRNGQPGDLVTVEFHQSVIPGTWPAVIMLPIWGISTYPPRKMTKTIKRLSQGRVHVLDVQGETYLLDWERIWNATDEASFLDAWRDGAERERTMVIDVRRLLDWAAARPEIDGERIALIGFSHSAMLAAVIASNEPRVAATVLVFGGAHPHQVIAHCDGRRTTGVQAKVAQEFGWSRDEFEQRLEPIFRAMDPARYRSRVDPASVLVFEAEGDPCVAETARAALWEAMGRPERYTVGATHRRAFLTMTPLYFNWLRYRVWDFLDKTLVSADGRREPGGG